MSKPVKKNSWLRGLLLGLGALFGILALMIVGMLVLARGMSEAMSQSQIEKKGEAARPILEAIWGRPLPTEASDLLYFSYGGIEGHGYARFSLPASAWNEQFASRPECAPISKDDPLKKISKSLPKDWWTPKQDAETSLLLDGTCSGGRGDRLRLLLDTSDPNTYVMYAVSG